MWQAISRLLSEQLGEGEIELRNELPGGEVHAAWHLWSGNCALGPDGPYIFDPACYWGDRECDLAMLPLHTEQPPQIYDGYQSVSPLPSDFLERQPIYQLYTLLNRARLFGGQHLVIAQQSLDRLLAA